MSTEAATEIPPELVFTCSSCGAGRFTWSGHGNALRMLAVDTQCARCGAPARDFRDQHGTPVLEHLRCSSR